jgi:hypothetical protein
MLCAALRADVIVVIHLECFVFSWCAQLGSAPPPPFVRLPVGYSGRCADCLKHAQYNVYRLGMNDLAQLAQSWLWFRALTIVLAISRHSPLCSHSRLAAKFCSQLAVVPGVGCSY